MLETVDLHLIVMKSCCITVRVRAIIRGLAIRLLVVTKQENQELFQNPRLFLFPIQIPTGADFGILLQSVFLWNRILVRRLDCSRKEVVFLAPGKMRLFARVASRTAGLGCEMVALQPVADIPTTLL